jgi:uncharacterized protein HemY
MKKILSVLLSMGLLTTGSSALPQEEIAAVMSMQTALKKEPENPAFLSELGLAYIKNKKFQEATRPKF